MKISKNVLAEIRRRANKIEIPDSVLYNSPEFREYYRNQMKAVLGAQAKGISLQAVYEPTSNATGCTDGNNIFCNLGSELSQHFETQEGRFLSNLGLLFHECAHILYTDFDRRDVAHSQISGGVFWPENPVASNSEERSNLRELLSSMNEPKLRDLLFSAVKMLENIICDAHDEAVLCSNKGELVNRAISCRNTARRAGANSLEAMIEAKTPELTIMYALLLQYARFYDIVLESQDSWNTEFGKKLQVLIPIIVDSRFTESTEERYRGINQILLNLWPYIKTSLNEAEQNQNQQGDGNQQGNGSQQGSSTAPSDQAVQQVMQQLSQAMQNAGLDNSSPSPQNRSTAPTAGQPAAAGDQSKQPDTNGTDTGSAAFSQLIGTLAQDQAQKDVEKELTKALQTTIDAQDPGDLHKDCPLQVKRPLTFTDDMKKDYLTELEGIKRYSATIQRKLKSVLKDLNDDDPQRTYFGKILKAEDAYRPDQMIFFKKGLPADLPDMAVAVLVDESGSMNSGVPESRIDVCRRAAILIDDFTSGMDIPLMVAGHHVRGYGCDLDVYVPFERASQNDRYRLMSMKASGCNRDGLALRTIVNLMMKRPERVRLVFIISDGRPSDGPHGETAYAELRQICKQAKKNGIEVIAAGIGDDNDILTTIYGDRFLDISDLDQLPAKLLKQIRKRITPH